MNSKINVKYLLIFLIGLMLTAFQAFSQGKTRGFDRLTIVSTLDGDMELYSKSKALLIAINEYDDDKWPDLTNPLRDIAAIEVVLSKQGFEITKLTDETDDKPTGVNIEKYVKNFHAEAGPGDRLLLFYAGHGYSEKEYHGSGYTGYIIPKDGEFKNWATYIGMQEIASVSKRSKANHIIYLFDSCFSGLFIDQMRAANEIPSMISAKIQKSARVAISAGSHDEQVADDYCGHSPFCTFFIRAFEDPLSDYNKDGYLTGSELTMYIVQNVPKVTHGAQNPLGGKMIGFHEGDIVFEMQAGIQIGQLKITTNSPDNVELYIDGNMRQYALSVNEPLTIDLTAGEHEILITGNYGSVKDDVVIRPDEIKHFEAILPLKSQLGSLKINSSLSDEAAVYLDKRKYNRTVSSVNPLQIDNLPAGEYFLELMTFDKTDSATIFIIPDQTTEYVAEFSDIVEFDPLINVNEFLKLAVFVDLPGGTFSLGASPEDTKADEDEFPRHEVTISPFSIMTTEVTQEMWLTMMQYNQSEFTGENLPVQNVSWQECMKFITRLNRADPGKNYRLPTEAEWEYACRAGTGTAYYAGDVLRLSDANFYDVSSFADLNSQSKRTLKTTLVKSYPPNPWGLFDMHGNVCEWCDDWKNPYPNFSQTDPRNKNVSDYKVHRGGCYLSIPDACRSSNRNGESIDSQKNKIGFRIVRDCR